MTLPSMQTLRAFDAAARHGSYSEAAIELGVTHGAISHRIRELEERLNVNLFRRAGRVMAPTREAVALLSQVRQGLDALSRAFPEPLRGDRTRLVVSAHPSMAYCWLAPNIGDFIDQNPHLDVEIRSTADLEDFLDPGVDVAIRYGGGGWPNVNEERLSGAALFPVCSPSYQERLNIRHPEDLARCTLLQHSWQAWTPWFRKAGLRLSEPVLGTRFSDNAMALAAAASDQGVALGRGLFAIGALQTGALVRLFDIQLEDSNGFYMVWRNATLMTKPAGAFRDWIGDALRRAEAQSSS